MSEEITSAIRDSVEAIMQSDLEKLLSFFAVDATLVAPEGVFNGREEIKRYWNWQLRLVTKKKLTETGVGIIVQGNKALYEFVCESTTTEGMKWRHHSTCVFQFTERKIQHLRIVYDRLSIAKQIARGWLEKRIVDSIVKQSEKGLH